MSVSRDMGNDAYLYNYDMREPGAREVLKFHMEELEQELNAGDVEGFVNCVIIFKPRGKCSVFANVHSMGEPIGDERIRQVLRGFAEIPAFGGGK